MPKLLKKFTPGRGYTEEDWDEVSDNPELTKENIANARPFAEAHPDLAATFKGRGPQKTPTKVAISIRLSRDVVDAFKASGPGWQSRIDEALRATIKRAS